MLQDVTGQSFFVRVIGYPRTFDTNGRTALTHAWVNVDFMLDACLVGFLVPEPSP